MNKHQSGKKEIEIYQKVVIREQRKNGKFIMWKISIGDLR